MMRYTSRRNVWLVQQSYTARYNHFNQRTGHVFEQRYKAFLCHDEAHLLSVIRYIHQNPLRAGLEGGLDHVYSSHKDYMSQWPSGLTDVEYPLRLFASERTESIRKYAEFVRKDNPMFNPYQVRVEHEPVIIGSPKTIDAPLSQLLNDLAALSGFTVADITGPSRRRDIVAVRRALVRFCKEHTRVSQVELARALGVSDAAISLSLKVVSEDINENVFKQLKNLSLTPTERNTP